MKLTPRNFFQRLKSPQILRVLLVYAGASWGVLQVLDVLDHFGLPDWFFFTGVILLLLGLPVILGTAVIQAGKPEGYHPLAPVEIRNSHDEVFRILMRWFTWPRAILAGSTAFLILGAVAFSVAWVRDPGRDLDRGLIAVIPFHTVGSDVEIWGEGLVDLLSTALDGTGAVSAADPRAVLNGWRATLGTDGDLGSRDQAIGVAIGLGAGRMIVGSLIQTAPDTVRVSADLFDVRWKSKEASVAVEGPQSQMIAMVDQLAVELLKSVLEEDRVPEIRISAVTTISVPALKAYMEGTRELRASQFEGARRAFERAVAEDSTFAIAAYGLSRAAGWADMEEAHTSALLLASRHTAGLTPRDSLLIMGHKRMEVDEDPGTIELFQNLALLHPEDFEAWEGLAEAVFHHGHEVGYHLDRVVDAMEHAYAIDSTVAPSYFHGIQSAFILDDTARARRWSQTYLKLDPSSAYAQALRLALALRLGSYVEREKATEALDTASADLLNRILWFAPAGRSSLPYSELVLRAAAAPRFRSAQRTEALSRLIAELLRNGQVKSALRLAAETRTPSAESHDLLPLTAMRVAGILGDSAVNAAYDRMVEASGYPEDSPFLAALWAAEGQFDKAGLVVPPLERSGDSLAAVGDTANARDRRGAALAYQGHIAAARGDTAAAIDLLRRGVASMSPDWSGVRSIHRFVLARLLKDHGAEDEALTIFRALRRPSSLEALSYLEAAGLYERRGEWEAARRYYSWTLDLWAEADSYLEPWIDSARQGLARLDGFDIGTDALGKGQ